MCAVVLVSACGGDDDAGDGARSGEAASEAVTVLSAFYPIHEVVTRVGGDRVQAVNLTPAGTEPHDMELAPDDVEGVQNADAVFYLGQGFMPALDRALRRADGEAIDLLEGLPLHKSAHDHDHDHGHGDGESLDPHVWLDPTLMARMAIQVEETLSRLDPDGETEYAKRQAEYGDELEALDRDYEDTLVDCQRNVFLTSHEAFGYLARRYQLEEQAVSGLSPGTEPDPNRIAQLADVIADLRVPVVFAETLLPKDLAEALAREASVRVEVLNPIEGLTEDELD
ncbi:MAG: metal ABC transporter substrate-binding protein, partial [Acidimicrobiia bacterium]